MSLLRLPDELILQCSFHVVAHDPLGAPHTLIPLALICRAFKLVVTSHAFKARICRLMFDVGPVSRRLFHPRDRDLADELVRCCNVLKEIRRGDVTESEDSFVYETLFSAYILMLSNDGKNYAQLEHAGLDAYVNKFIATRFWDGRETNQGWPLASQSNSCALWLMWMTLTKQKLAAQVADLDRSELMHKLLPYVVLPFRYASSSAPPNHFNLPLDPQNPHHQKPLITTAHETPYPIYLEDLPDSNLYFNARIPICSPLITIAAKLLFVAIKEMTSPNRPPPHLPQAPGPGIVGLTQEDFREVFRNPAARLCRVVTWNWDTGSPNRVGGEEGDAKEIDEDWEESKVWDTEWWRRLLCTNFDGARPKYLPGNVFNLGSMRGSWAGKKYVPGGPRFNNYLHNPDVPYPGFPNPSNPSNPYFTEDSINLGLDPPVILDIQEHHKICECAQGSPDISESHPYVAPTLIPAIGSASSSTPTSLPIGPQSGRCGIVPIPSPLVFQASQTGQNQGEQEGNEGQVTDAIALSLPTPRVDVIDCSMSNAWFPGNLRGVSFTKLSTPSAGDGKRDKVICAVDSQAPDIRGVLNRPEESECLSLGGRRRQQDGQGKMNAFVYETYDPEKTSMHRGLSDSISDAGNAFISASSSSGYPTDDPHQCQSCLQREALIRRERKKAEDRSRRMLDRGLRSYESGGGYNWSQDDVDMDDEDEEMEDGDEDEEGEDKEMRDVDMDELGIDVDGIIEKTTSFSRESTSSIASDDDSMSSQLVSFGDDDPEENLDEEWRGRRRYDKCRIGVECKGVADVLLSGESAPRSAVWQQKCKLYGRVRPWDGLIGILKSISREGNHVTNFFIFGYIVGENNFVGEWRLAATHPLCPTWSNALVMSRKIGGR